MNRITDLLDLVDSDLVVTDCTITGTTKYLTLETPPQSHHCPLCSFRMHSRGTKTRKIKHPILQDNYELVLLLKQRRWKCTNPACLYSVNESFNFVNKSRRTTNATEFLIVEAFRDLSASASSIAQRFHVSDQYVLDVFDKYIDLDRLPLTDVICIDEVCIDMDNHCRYALLIQDFHTGEPIDLLSSRRQDITEPYFASIPIQERLNVKYLISDMYAPYIAYVDKYFPNAVPVVDSFHVIQWVNHMIETHIRGLLRKYRQRDQLLKEAKERAAGHPVTIPASKEVYLLQRYRWLILKNHSSINYDLEPHMDRHLHRMMNTYDYEWELFRIDPNLEDLRNLKELYIHFNRKDEGDPMQARIDLDQLIHRYLNCNQNIFREFADLLIRYHDPIINSFVMAEKHSAGMVYDSRLSNGPIESINRKVKDLNRLGRGYRNFQHFRNRFLFSTRQNPPLRIPSTRTEVDP